MGIVMSHPILNFAIPKILDEDRIRIIEGLLEAIADPTIDHQDRDIADWIIYAAKEAIEGNEVPSKKLIELYKDIYMRDAESRHKARGQVLEECRNYEALKTENVFVPDYSNFE
jgi:hypothetical protein